MIAARRDISERDRQALLTFRLSAIIVVLTALLAWTLADRYFGLWAAAEAVLATPTTGPSDGDPDMNAGCSADTPSKTDRSIWTRACPRVSSTIEAPAMAKTVAGPENKTF